MNVHPGLKTRSLEDRKACGAGGGGEPRKSGLGWITDLEDQAKAVAPNLIGLGFQ